MVKLTIDEFIEKFERTNQCLGNMDCEECPFKTDGKYNKCGHWVHLLKLNGQSTFIDYTNTSSSTIRDALVKTFIENYRRIK